MSPTVNPECENERRMVMERAGKERAAHLEAASVLICQCEEMSLAWSELPAGVQQRVCRQVQLAHNGRCFDGLAERLGVEPVDRRFYSEQSSGQLKSSTELMLEDVTRRAQPPSAALVLRFLLDCSLLRVLADVSDGVKEACALRRQQLLHSGPGRSPMDSGYQSSEHSGADIVGVLSEPPDTTLVEAAPIHLRTSPPLSKRPRSKKLMLTYAVDGRDAARDLAQRLKEFGFRVMLLGEQRRHRLPDPYSAVQKWFIGVDYILPVLTPQYFAATQNCAQPSGEPACSLAKDARFVYTLMCAEMEANLHVNYRVRAVVPEGVEESLRDHPLYGSPLFRFPFGISELETLAECLED